MNSSARVEELTKLFQTTKQIMNDLGELFYVKESVNIDQIEKIVLDNMARNFSQGRMAELVGRSVRTIRNKTEVRMCEIVKQEERIQ